MFPLSSVGFEVKCWVAGVGTVDHSLAIPEPILSVGGDGPEGCKHSRGTENTILYTEKKKYCLLWTMKNECFQVSICGELSFLCDVSTFKHSCF